MTSGQQFFDSSQLPGNPGLTGYLERCFERHSPPRVGELAAYLHLSRGAVWLRITQATGSTPCSLLRNAQVARACALLRSTGLPICDVAAAAGFDTERTFFAPSSECSVRPLVGTVNKVSVDAEHG